MHSVAHSTCIGCSQHAGVAESKGRDHLYGRSEVQHPDEQEGLDAQLSNKRKG